jgi:hypothetical protein
MCPLKTLKKTVVPSPMAGESYPVIQSVNHGAFGLSLKRIAASLHCCYQRNIDAYTGLLTCKHINMNTNNKLFWWRYGEQINENATPLEPAIFKQLAGSFISGSTLISLPTA